MGQEHESCRTWYQAEIAQRDAVPVDRSQGEVSRKCVTESIKNTCRDGARHSSGGGQDGSNNPMKKF
eukprot:12933687-Prorocentrum_lima.AAC.1